MTTDDLHLPELTRRQEEILSCIVRSYTDKPEPVSSKYVADHFALGVSSATIRNEMAVLEELGYINAPHTSAGRVPTESGYRYFVKRLINATDLTIAEQNRISERLHSLPLGTEQWMRLAATLLARTVQIASVVTPPIAETSRFQHLELISVQGRLVLMVLVLRGGMVQQQMLTLAEPVMQQTLTDTARRLNSVCTDLSASEIRMRVVPLSLFEREMGEIIADLMDRTGQQMRAFYRDGLSDVISAFQASAGAQQMVRVFEERAFMTMIFSEILTPLLNDVQVVIAGDGRWEELSHLSMILSRYGIEGQMSGMVGVLGPTHIDYGKAVSAVRYVSGLMTDMLADVYRNDADSDATSPPEAES